MGRIIGTLVELLDLCQVVLYIGAIGSIDFNDGIHLLVHALLNQGRMIVPRIQGHEFDFVSGIIFCLHPLSFRTGSSQQAQT